MDKAKNDTHQKALSLNLNPKIYGTIAEIGAGQEVARWFFHVGGAAGTVAKSISAYDMLVSDQLYGKGTRYVSRDRVVAMLDREFSILLERLGETRGGDTAFFAFSNTVAARNYAGTNECHGWLGLRYQTSAGSPPNDIVLHVNLLDNTNLLQQQALGILGINLIYGAFFERESRREFLLSLMDAITPGRIEIDAVYCAGPNFADADPIHIGTELIAEGLSKAVLFEKSGQLLAPTETFHNRPLLLVRSSFERPWSSFHGELLSEGVTQLSGELTDKSKSPISFLEINASNSDGTAVEPAALRKRISDAFQFSDRLLVTKFRENHLLTSYLRRYAPKEPIRFAIGASSLVLLFQNRYYSDLPGRVMEGLGRFLADNIKVYVKEMPRAEFLAHITASGSEPVSSGHKISGAVVGLQDLRIDPPLGHLYDYLTSIEVLIPLQG